MSSFLMNKHIAKSSFAAFLFIFTWTIAAGKGDLPDAPIRQKLNQQLYHSLGSCKGKEGSVDLESLLFLQNTEIKEKSDGVLSITKIDREEIHIEKYSSEGELDKRIILDVDADVAARFNEDDVDIDLYFVLLDKNEVAIYWKETYKYRTYRQGIYKISNDDISFLCDGRGGVYKSH